VEDEERHRERQSTWFLLLSRGKQGKRTKNPEKARAKKELLSGAQLGADKPAVQKNFNRRGGKKLGGEGQDHLGGKGEKDREVLHAALSRGALAPPGLQRPPRGEGIELRYEGVDEHWARNRILRNQ